jgi:tetratricopeptide (TPR) repeat protein
MDLPAVQNNLPARGGGGGGFGEIDLPSVSHANDLPMAQNNLPMTAQNNLPMAQNNLPMTAQNNLPMAQNNLPMTAQNNLPMAQNNLPMAQNNLPMTQPMGHNLPMAAGNQNLLPEAAQNQGLLPAMGDFGELDLPRAQPMGMQLPSAQQQRPGSGPPMLDGFGELDLPPPNRQPSGAPPAFNVPSVPPPGPSHPPGGAVRSVPPADQRGGVGFGEVDLGGEAAGTEMRLSGPAPAVSSGTLAGEEAARAAQAAVDSEAAKRRARTVVVQKSSRAPKIILGIAAVTLVAGTLLQLSPVGAFGHLWVSDKINAGDYLKSAQQGAEKARKRMGADTFAESRGAADELAQAHARTPRARGVAAYAAYAQFMTDMRFGKDSQANARATQWLTEIPVGSETKYTPLAQAAQAAVAGDLPKARKLLDTAAKTAGNDPIVQDLAFTRGETELVAKDGTAAVTAFKKAVDLVPNARAHFGLARGYELLGDTKKALEEVELALKASPNDAGALTLRAQLVWRRDHDEATVQKDLTAVTDGAAKATAAVSEQARAHAVRGLVFLSKDRSAEARAEFDKSLQLDARSVLALVGQGEVLFQDSRFGEALTRFDTALQTDALNIDAIVGDAKTQIALEKLTDAKTQLVNARAKFPKDMRVALWLGKAEEALGNKKAAEDQYLSAIDLADPTQPDTVSVYVALATLLATQGRAAEAEQKLEQAKQKLPDSAQLQRAFGEVAAAQGQYQRAVAFYEATLERDPNDVGTRFRLGSTLRRMRSIDAAAAQLDKVYEIDKEYPGLSLERGLLYEESGEVDKALEMFKGALAKFPNDPDLQLRVGAMYAIVGQPDKAMEMLNKVIELRQNSAEAHHYLGRALLQKGPLQNSRAMKELRKAVDQDPNRPEYHLYVGWAASDATPADLGLARSEIEKALQLDRLLGDGYWQLGVVEYKQGTIEDAIRHLKRALELKPSRYEAHATMAECLSQKNDMAGALAEWKKAIDADDKRPYWRYRYGKILEDRGANAEAARHLAYASQNAEADTPRPGWLPDAEFLAGETLRKTGKKAEAIERYRQYLGMAGPGAADRREAMKALQDLGAPYDPHAL